MIINIARDFARYPFGRYRTDGPYSGQVFREEVLVPALRSGAERITIELDGAIGMGSSFLEESFGGLVRLGYDKAELQRRLELVSRRDSTLPREIAGYIADAESSRKLASA